MKHEYQAMLNHIHVPDGLNDQVLAATRQTAAPLTPERPTRKRIRPVLRAAVCAICALALVVGGVTLRPAERGDTSGNIEYSESMDIPTLTLSCDFALTAHAAANGGMAFAVPDNGLHFTPGTGPSIPGFWMEVDQGTFTDYRFRIEGENVETVALSVDQGGFYRQTGSKDPVPLGGQVSEFYDPDAAYGFWIPPEAKDIGLSVFDGAELTVTIGFTGGVEQSETYRLSAEALRKFSNENGSEVLVPILQGDRMEYSGIYAVPADSRWFQWPVQDSQTVSLSNHYGYRHAPGGQGGMFHAGIDIPAREGTVILAAEGGTVTETGFDAQRGNYLILDHGDGLTTLYGQCRDLTAKEGDAVEAGERIGSVGSTGMSTGPHLHFEVRENGEAQNPVAWFDSEIRDTLRMV